MTNLTPPGFILIHTHSLSAGLGATIVAMFLVYTLSYYAFAERLPLLINVAILEASLILFLGGFAAYVSAQTEEDVFFRTRICYTGVCFTVMAFHGFLTRVTGHSIVVMNIAVYSAFFAWTALWWFGGELLIRPMVKSTSGHPSAVKGILFVPFFICVFVSILVSFSLFARRFAADSEFRQHAWPVLGGFAAWIVQAFSDGLNATGVVTYGTFPWFGPVLMLMLIGIYMGRVTIGTRRELQAANQSREELLQKLMRDELSGLYSRNYLLSVLEKLPGEEKCALCFLDIDDFKDINDSYGHAAGDQIIQEIGRILREGVGTDGIAARFGGDEFVLLLRSESHRVLQAMTEVRDRVRSLKTVSGSPAGVSIGFTSFVGREYSPDLIDRVDNLMYAAKSQGKNRIAYFEFGRVEVR